MAVLTPLQAASPLDLSDDSRLLFTVDTTETLSRALDDTDSDLSNMDTLSWQVEYRQSGWADDTVALGIRIVNGATILAAADSGGTFATVDSNVTNTTDTTSAVTAFAYVNTGASKATWDGASVELQQTYTKNKGADGVRIEVDFTEFTGTYTAGGTNYTETPTETVGVTDATSPVKAGAATATDPVGVTDATSRVHPAKRTPTDPAGVTELVAAAKTITVTITDPVGVADTVADALTVTVTITEAVGTTDTLSTAKTATQAVTEVVGASDTPTRVAAAKRTAAAAAGVTDPVTTAKTITVVVTETVGASDAPAATKNIVVTVTEAAAVADATSKVSDVTRIVTDDAGVTDAATEAKTVTVAISDPVGVTDTVTTGSNVAVAEAVDGRVAVVFNSDGIIDLDESLTYPALDDLTATRTTAEYVDQYVDVYSLIDDYPPAKGWTVLDSDDGKG